MTELLAHEVIVEEKVDGANLGLSVDESGELRAQNRGSYISRNSAAPQFRTLFPWLAAHEISLINALSPNLILFGEWCYAVHSVRYSKLKDWFLAFDVYDRCRTEFWSASRRDDLARGLGIATVPLLARGRFDLGGLQGLLGQSKVGEGPAEGLYVRREEGGRLISRAKLVRPEFVQSMDEHWSKISLRVNKLAA